VSTQNGKAASLWVNIPDTATDEDVENIAESLKRHYSVEQAKRNLAETTLQSAHEP
jgi:hypothetical protein